MPRQLGRPLFCSSARWLGLDARPSCPQTRLVRVATIRCACPFAELDARHGLLVAAGADADGDAAERHDDAACSYWCPVVTACATTSSTVHLAEPRDYDPHPALPWWRRRPRPVDRWPAGANEQAGKTGLATKRSEEEAKPNRSCCGGRPTCRRAVGLWTVKWS